MATFVLVHGGGHGGWCFKPIAAILRAEGHVVYAPSLTGLADRQHLLSAETDLEMHIQDVTKLMDFEDLSEVILVGHSYGGMVITGAADRASARTGHLVYLDAAIPLDGEALIDVSPGLAAFAANNRVIDGVELGLFPDAAASAVYGLHGSPIREWAMARLTPQPWRTMTQPLALRDPATLAEVPRTIINSTRTLAVRPPQTRSRWLEGDRVWSLDAPHDLMLTHSVEVAELLLRIV